MIHTTTLTLSQSIQHRLEHEISLSVEINLIYLFMK